MEEEEQEQENHKKKNRRKNIYYKIFEIENVDQDPEQHQDSRSGKRLKEKLIQDLPGFKCKVILF